MDNIIASLAQRGTSRTPSPTDGDKLRDIIASYTRRGTSRTPSPTEMINCGTLLPRMLDAGRRGRRPLRK